MQPRLEPVGIAERPQVPPGRDVRGLHRVFGEVDIAKDPIRDAQAAVAGDADERIEGVFIASLRQFDQPTIHVTSLVAYVPGDALALRGHCGRKGSIFGRTDHPIAQKWSW